MPKNKEVDFIAIDEIQMCAIEKGVIFLLKDFRVCGNELTMFLGSQVMENIISELVSNGNFEKKERYSKLSYAGINFKIEKKVAIIAFSIEEVYAIAELVRRQKGGAAVIMGSLSPKPEISSRIVSIGRY